MQKTLANALEVDVNLISIKAKTNEHVDAVGEEKAIEANAIVMLQKEN